MHRREILGLINEELKRTKYYKDIETRQLQSNIKKSIGTATTNALKIWPRMIRNVKEYEQENKTDNIITQPRAQSITRFLSRPEGT